MNIIKYIIFIILGTQLISQAEINLNAKIKSDDSLIVPGLGAENIILRENAGELLTVKGYPDRIAEFQTKRELFKEVFKTESPVKIYFNKVYYYRLKDVIVFIHNNKISSIIGLNNYRVTIDSVNLSNGTEYFVFNYGNSGVIILNRKKNRIYIYQNLGIAIVDDNNDDIIDMYLVFSAGNK